MPFLQFVNVGSLTSPSMACFKVVLNEGCGTGQLIQFRNFKNIFGCGTGWQAWFHDSLYFTLVVLLVKNVYNCLVFNVVCITV